MRIMKKVQWRNNKYGKCNGKNKRENNKIFKK